MGVSPAVFESAGQKTSHLVPGVYTRNDSEAQSGSLGADKLVIMGSSVGGKSKTLLKFTSPSKAKDMLIGGDVLNGVLHAFTGSSDYVPQAVYAFIVNENSQAQLTLKKGASDCLVLKSAVYGKKGNNLKVWLKNGSSAGKKIDWAFESESGSIDNIEREAFSLMYQGSGDSAKCTILSNSIRLEATAEDETVDVFEVSFDDVETLSALVEKINDSGAYNATLLDNRESVSTAELDVCSATEIASGGTKFYSNAAALIEAFESISYIGEGNVSYASASTKAVPDVLTRYEYFTGGSSGNTSIDDWNTALAALEKEDVQSIATASTLSEVHTLISAHCALCSSTPKRKERQFFVGMPIGTSLDAAKAEAKQLNSKYGSLVANSMIATNALKGKTEEMSGALLACKVAGMENAMSTGNPLTNKMVNVSAFGGLGEDDFDEMIASGIMPFGTNDNGELVCIRAMTTYQGDDLTKNERSCVREALFMARDFRAAYSRTIGRNDEPSESDVTGILIARAKDWYEAGLITLDDSQNAVFNIEVTFDADKTYIKYARYLRTPRNFVFGTATDMLYKSA